MDNSAASATKEVLQKSAKSSAVPSDSRQSAATCFTPLSILKAFSSPNKSFSSVITFSAFESDIKPTPAPCISLLFALSVLHAINPKINEDKTINNKSFILLRDYIFLNICKFNIVKLIIEEKEIKNRE